ncbi:MAG: NAD(P)H-binding protein [Rhodospirillaceae bacterium]|nr:NAD(P)H-binding protein [Rhodospirillaceae bacterium]
MAVRVLCLLLGVLIMSTPAAANDSPIKSGGALVFGGAGRAGAEIAKVLLARGETVTVFARPTTDHQRLKGLSVSYVEGDAMNAADVAAAFAKAKPATAINIMSGGQRMATGFWDVTQKNITAAAKASGTKLVVFFSSVGVGDSAVAYSEAALERGKVSLADRFTAEEDLKASGVPYLIIRTGIIAPDRFAPTGKARLTEDRKVLAPVTRPDLARLLGDCLADPGCRNKTYAAADETITLGPPTR